MQIIFSLGPACIRRTRLFCGCSLPAMPPFTFHKNHSFPSFIWLIIKVISYDESGKIRWQFLRSFRKKCRQTALAASYPFFLLNYKTQLSKRRQIPFIFFHFYSFWKTIVRVVFKINEALYYIMHNKRPMTLYTDPHNPDSCSENFLYLLYQRSLILKTESNHS